jgi:hypothetical protein
MNGINNMQSLKRLEKSKGVVLFAFNNADTDYVKLTSNTIRLIKHNLNLPVTLVTGPDEVVDFEVDNIVRIESQGGNTRYSTEAGQRVQWRNFGRYMAYELSPYDETILMDTDYLVLDKSLLAYFDTDWDYLIPHRNINLGQDEFVDTMGMYSLPFVWATVVLFRKTAKAEMLFDLVGRVQRNYNYYKMLYNIPATNYRNDYAFAIADYLVNGYHVNKQTQLPRPLLTATGQLQSIDHVGSFLHVKDTKSGYVVPMGNLHVLSKGYLLSDNFKTFVDQYCAA